MKWVATGRDVLLEGGGTNGKILCDAFVRKRCWASGRRVAQMKQAGWHSKVVLPIGFAEQTERMCRTCFNA